ncbi:MAG: zinc ribbon domain-containing protein, partial [bacterium]
GGGPNMPIYEFYCHDCNTVFNFFSRSVNTTKHPACPKCRKRRLRRQVSLFAATGNAKEDQGTDKLPMDEAKMERAMNMLEKEASGMKEDDPRQAAELMRKFSDATGMSLGKKMEEALGRLESGEDPERVEADMGDALDGNEDPLMLPGTKPREGSRRPPPQRDETLYEM